MNFEVKRYPAWRQMFAEIRPHLPHKTEWTYEDLDQAGGIDVRTDSGRGQFYRFRRECLKELGLWFENVPGVGYSVIPAEAHTKAAVKRVGSARRKLNVARAINGLVNIENLTPEQRALQSQAAALLHSLSTTFNKTARQLAAASNRLLQSPKE